MLPLLLLVATSAVGQVVVETVDPGTAAAKAGLLAGDSLAGWRREAQAPANPRAASGRFASWLDVEAALIEEAPRGRFSLDVVHEGKRLRVLLPQGDWGFEARPAMADPAAACWLAVRAAKDLASQRRLEPARTAFSEARGCVERIGGKPALVRLLVAEGMALRGVEDYANAAATLREAATAAASTAPRSLLAAHAWHQLGLVERFRGELDAARAAFEKARSIREEVAPRSLVLGYTYNNLGIVCLMRSELGPAEAWCRKALARMRQADPQGSGEGDVLNNLSLIARDRGDYAAAERHLARATGIRRALGPGSASYGSSLVNLAVIASDRGDLARSDGLLEEALALFEKIAPGGLPSAHVLNNLGVSARDRGDFGAAEDLLRRALAIREKLVPESLEVASTLSNLGAVLELSGRLPDAVGVNERALAIRQKRAPEGIEASWSLEAIGHVARAQGDLEKARDFFQRAAALRQKAGPGRAYAGALANLGAVLRDVGDLDGAEATLRKALDLLGRLAPESLVEAETAHSLGDLLRERGDPAGARALFDRALDGFDAQLGRIGGSDEGRAEFAAERDAAFKDQIDLLEETGHRAEAFQCRERGRARALLAMLAGRDVDLSGELPGELRAIALRLDGDIRRLEGVLAKAETRSPSEEKLLARLRALRERRGRLDARAARSSPRLAALRVPRPLDAVAARATLERGELLLAYTVLPESTILFVLPPPDVPLALAAVRLPVGRDALASEVSLFRSLILAGREKPERDPALETQARRLWDLLLGPAEARVRGARRLLLSPDGPLELLPFAALRSPAGRYLAEEVPLRLALSVTAMSERARRRRERRGEGVVVFGDPDVPVSTEPTDGSPLVRYRLGLPPLPAARAEAEAVASLFGSAARLYLGREATEERARQAGSGARYVHFASHALLDRRFPTESGLAFARPGGPGGEDGLLQAWEVIRDVRLEADLVTLSGCETALGAENGGEGLLGLTRAFEIAGAHSVLASLWSVSDRSTTLLMTAFYEGLRRGLRRDDALKAAEIQLLRGSYPHPFYWAPFVLSGDPR